MIIDHIDNPNTDRNQDYDQIQFIVVDQHLKTLVTKWYDHKRGYLYRIDEQMVESSDIIYIINNERIVTKNK
mgnify:CR=1 FL=1